MEHKTRFFTSSRRSIAGNALAMVFMAVGMAGVVTYGLNNIMRGPAVTAAEASRITIAENNLVATTRLAISAAAQMQSNNGDCDGDGFVEPVPFRSAGTAPAPAGGGLVPMTIGASMTDPWGTAYGYCVWDPGTVSQSDNHPGCDNATGSANRLQGAPRDDQPAIAVISAGKNGVFDTTCNAYVDANNDGQPDVPLVVEGGGSDDIVLTYTYAEANGVGGGLWRLRESDPTIAEIDRGIRSTSRGGATFGGAVELTNRGLVLPGDPGDDSVTGPCDAAKDGQLRRNISGSPPTIEICDHTGGNGWIQISGSGDVTSGFNPERGNCTRNQGGPLSVVDQFTSGGSTRQIWSTAGQPLQQLHVASATAGLTAMTFDGTEFVSQSVYGAGVTNWAGAWSNGTHIFVSGSYGGARLVALTFDGASYTQTGMLDLSGMSASSITGINDVVFVPMFTGEGLRAYRYSAGTFTLLDTFTTAPSEDPSANTEAHDVWTDGTNVFYVSLDGPLRVAQWDGSQFINRAAASNTYEALTAWSDGNYIYQAGYGGLRIYTYNGTSLNLVHSDNSIGYTGLWGDGVYIYGATTTGIRVLRFDGTSLTVIDENNTLGYGWGIWGDGNFIYLGIYAGDIYALGGYGCLDPNPEGGAGAGSSAIQRQPPLADPLDVGLVAHWKMDELSGSTTVTDSIGENHGERLDRVSTTLGQDGGMALNLSGPTSTGAVRVTGLLGEPQQGTIAGWVNLGAPTVVGGAPPDRAMILSIGGYVNLYENYDNESTLSHSGLVLEVNSGGTPQRTRSNFQLTGAGWRYVVATFDTVDDMFRIYVDGNLVAQENQNWSITYSGGGTNTFIGRHGGGQVDWGFNGSVDDFRVYGRALGPAEVAALSARHLSMGAKAPPVISPLRVAGKSGRFSMSNLFGCGIKDDGTLWCWGMDDGSGNLGRGKFGPSSKVPVQVVEPDQFVYYLNNTDSDLSIGGSSFSKKMLPYMQGPQADLGTYTASQSRTGYGFTDPGMPGIEGVSGNREYMLKVRPLTPEACLSASAVLARINATGVVQTSLTLTPEGSSALSSEVTLRARGDLGTFARTDRLRVQYNINNTCGSALGWTQLVAQLHVPLKPHSPWVFIDSTCAIKADGTAWCWGYGGEGSLGNSSFTSASQSTPSPVVHNGVPWVSISGRADHKCGIKSDGSLWCWGQDEYGQLGNGATAGIQYQPFRVGTDNDWMSVKTAWTFSCALKTNGTAWCWGQDQHGQLGNGATSADQTSPVLVSDPGPWIKIAVGNFSACGIKADSSLWCWGQNNNYRLGTLNGTTDVPTKISVYPDGWMDVSLSESSTCGIRNDGTVWCWGEGGGRGWQENTHVPQQVMGISGATAIDKGSFGQSCVSKTDGALYCWGWNGHGTLGDGFYRAHGGYPTAVLGFPGSPGWGWNDTESIIAGPYNFNVGLNGSLIGDIGNNQRGFGFTSAGRARLYQNAAGVQLGLQAGAGGNSLLAFKTTPAMGAIDVTFGLTGRWPLDTNANATVGGINGTNNGATFITERKVGTGATVFDGVDDYIQMNRNAGVMEHASFSVAFWVRRTGNQVIFATILNKFNTMYGSYSFTLQNGRFLVFMIRHTDTSYSSVSADLPDEKWTHVVGTFTPTGSNNIKLYIDGKLAQSNTRNVAIGYDTSANGRLYLGGCPTCTGYFKGTLDDVRIYNRALSANEVAILHGTQLAPWANNMFRMGANVSTDRFEITTPTDTLLTMPASGLTSIGTAAPATRLDVQGGVRIGNEDTCNTDRAGALRYTAGNSPPLTYCNGTSWGPLASSTLPWKKKASDSTLCGIRADGRAYCWGWADNGRIGNNVNVPDDTLDELSPVAVHSDSSATGWNDWVSIVGADTQCGLRANGTLWCWGYNGRSTVGDGANTSCTDQADFNRLRPVQVRDTAGTGYWSDWVAVSSLGYDIACGLRANGRAYCWGYRQNSALGNGTNSWPCSATPQEVHTNVGSPGWSDWIQLSAAPAGGCGVRRNGTAWCWGLQLNGRLGNGTAGNRTRPVQVRDNSGGATFWSDWIRVVTGWENSCGIRSNGRGYCWGENSRGQLGNGGGASSTYPREINSGGCGGGFTNWVDLSVAVAGGNDGHVCGVRANGEAYCWGNNNFGKLGDGTTTQRNCPTRVRDSAGTGYWSDWVKINTQLERTCGTRADGSMWCWGTGPLGNGATGNSSLPRQVQ